MSAVKLTRAKNTILEVFLTNPGREYHAYEVFMLTELSTGTVYPTLEELANAGLLISRDVPDHETDGAPRRKYYRIEPAAVADIQAVQRAARELWARPRRRQGQRTPIINWGVAAHA